MGSEHDLVARIREARRRLAADGPPRVRSGGDFERVDADLAARAMSGWRRYGKGRHPAGLNFGDCFTYALAERTGHPVLCTGDDFAATDITVVRPRPTPDEAQAAPE